MPELSYLPDQKRVECRDGDTILQSSLRAQIPHAHACGGNARCSTCRVSIQEGLEHCAPRNEAEQEMAERLHFAPCMRLACQTRVTGDVQIRRIVLDDEDEELTAQLLANPTPSAVGEEKRIAILFADIRGFTSFSERLLPYDVVHVLNRYFNHIGQAITANGGDINNYIGDGILALFGLTDTAEAARQAVCAGLAMLAAVEQLQPYLREAYAHGFEIGVGIHFGDAVIGDVGYGKDRRVTAIGDSVNFASRIESANKEAGTNLLISEDTYQQVREQVRIGKTLAVELKGKSGSYTLYEVVGFAISSS